MFAQITTEGQSKVKAAIQGLANRYLHRQHPVIEPGQPFIVCENLVRIYQVADIEVQALQGLDMVINKGELMAIIGSSGSGKSTLLNILGGLDEPTAGKVYVAGWNLSKLSYLDRVYYKRKTVGFVWQNVSRNLIPYLSALENVQLPMILAGKLDTRRAKELLEAVGLSHRMHHRPLEMSGGEQQRVGIAVALANNPQVLLADEPTGSLDTKGSEQVLAVLRQVRDTYGVTVVVVTHDRSMAHAVDRYVLIRDGKISMESVRRPPTVTTFAEDEEQQVQHENSHDEYVVLDSAGRLQLPEEYIKQLGLKGRAKVSLEEGQIVIRALRDKVKETA